MVILACLLALPWLNPGTSKRIAAALVDLAIAVAIFMAPLVVAAVIPVPLPPGQLLAALYLLFRDTPPSIVGSGRGSPGKQLLGVMVSDRRGLTPALERTLIRNLPLALAAVLSWWPASWAPFAYPALPLLELLTTTFAPSGRRIGDRLAGTQVVTYTTR